MKTADCPYCGSDTFSSDVIRADAIDPKNPEKYARIEGHYFNQCVGCDGWSIYRKGKQFPIPDKSNRPRPYSDGVNKT